MNMTLINKYLLPSYHIQHNDLFSVLERMYTRHLDYADIYLQSKYQEILVLESSIIKDGFYSINQGVGVRAIKGEKTGFSYADQITLTALKKSALTACSIVNESGNTKIKRLETIKCYPTYPHINPLSSLSREEKISLLYRINNVARSVDTRVQEVTASLSGIYEHILVAASDGTLATDIRPLVRLSIHVHVEQDGKREYGTSGGGGRCDYNFFMEKDVNEARADIWTREAVHMALVNLSAIETPAGPMPVVLGAGWPGVLLHEAIGHGLEGDFNRHGNSIFSGQIGNKVASELCTVVDDGTLNNLCGSLSIDDEGVPGQYNVLIENGQLKGYMHDKLSARFLDSSPTGNGRRESYAHLPMPRMTNTYMLAGQSKPADIISSVDYGIYAPNLGGGQVDITSGKFVFSITEAYMIEKGRLTRPIKGAMLIGSSIDIMNKISMVGNDLALDRGVGMCEKEGQSLPVNVGQPTLKIDKITIGGTT
ncbi:metalloprotease TldD [Candidatus Curculioniphilus buchneri]|uniref:metalloprotease TldD n=1 Tax=Candidatus Curculioniphilus buchneri TaxID=690594 RepID=UPI00376ED638